MVEVPLLLVIFSIGMVIALVLYLIEYLLEEYQQKKKDKLLEQINESQIDINELTPDEIELIRCKRTAESINCQKDDKEKTTKKIVVFLISI
jgi:hypothetical protein